MMKRKAKPSEAPTVRLCTVPELKSRGWTLTAIARFLPTWDDTRHNPKYRSAAPMRLYSFTRVESIEASAEWQTWKAQSVACRARGTKAWTTRRSKLLAVVEGWKPKVEHVENVVEQAITYYNERNIDKDWKRAAIGDNSEFLHRITRNYIRHTLTNYDDLLNLLPRECRDDAYAAVRDNVEDAIDEVYPDLP